MGDRMCLVAFDTDRIKDYLFATPDLRKIRGASTLLEILNRADENLIAQIDPHIASIRTTIRQIHPEIQENHIITAGGAAMALVPEALAPRVIEAVEGLYRQKTVTASITGAAVPLNEHELQHEFGRCLATVRSHLRFAKDQKGQERIVPLTAWLRPCGACGRYPARYPSTDAAGRAELICQSCQIKDEWSDVARNFFWQDFLDKAGTFWVQTFPKDFGEIGSISRPPGYVGFIYADGNGIGALLEEMRTFDAFQTFAKGLDRVVRQTTHQALLDVLREPRRATAPFEILLIGGDDLMLVVAADAALDVALTITKQFERLANEVAHSPEIGLPATVHLSLSAGVVIAHDSFPLKAMHDLAAALLKSAKRASPQFGDVGTIDFMVVTEAATAGLDAVRDQVLSGSAFVVPPPPGEKFTLTERPYTVERLRKLLWHASTLKKFPRTSLHAMYEGLFQSKLQAQFTTMTALGRAKPEDRDMGWKFFDDFGVPRGTLPWRENPDKPFTSPLADLLEIYPFVWEGRENGLDTSRFPAEDNS